MYKDAPRKNGQGWHLSMSSGASSSGHRVPAERHSLMSACVLAPTTTDPQQLEPPVALPFGALGESLANGLLVAITSAKPSTGVLMHAAVAVSRGLQKATAVRGNAGMVARRAGDVVRRALPVLALGLCLGSAVEAHARDRRTVVRSDAYRN